jgi:hypothetical protein
MFERMPHWWASDVLGLTGLVVAAVVGWSGGFWGSRVTFGATLLLILSFQAAPLIGGLPLIGLGLMHLALAPVKWARLKSQPTVSPES